MDLNNLLGNKTPLLTHSKTLLRASPIESCCEQLDKLLSTKSSSPFL